MVVGPCAGGELADGGQLRPSTIIVQGNPCHLLYQLYRTLSSSRSLPTTRPPSSDFDSLTHSSQPSWCVTKPGASSTQTAHTANHTRSSPSPSASSPPQATPPKPPAHPPHPQPPASTTLCAPTNPSTHPTTPRPLSLPSPPHTHWKLASPTGARLKMHSR